MTDNKHTDIDETVKLEVEQTTEMPVASIDEEATISSTDNSPASGEDPTTRIEVAETTELPVSSVEEASEELPETKASGTTEEESELPEPNFDPAEEPSAFDPRITGEYSP
ncbi:MAG: hypothetical protein Q4E01_06660, partial [Actinomycetaceae bacterium]|nr:hypothetical protein [Actinomycetaceae bacterium]